MNLPTTEAIEALHRSYAPSEEAFKEVYEHCCIVWTIAEEVIAAQPSLDINPQLVKIGCLLHDIGVYELYGSDGTLDQNNYITHGILGYELLKSRDYPEHICRFASHHTGVGLTKEDVISQKLPLPSEDFVAETPEERLVMFADKFHSKSGSVGLPTFNTATWYKQYVVRFGVDKVRLFEEMLEEFGEPQLKPIMQRFGYAQDRLR